MACVQKIIKIPRDPRYEEIVFFESIPENLMSLIDADEWKDHISKLNRIFLKKERPSWMNFLKNLLLIPSIFANDSFDSEISACLYNLNAKLRTKGIRIDHPKYTSYSELIVYYS